MQSPRVLIDSSIWIEYLRGNDAEIVATVRELIVEGRATLCGVVLAELITGIKRDEDRRTLVDLLDGQSYLKLSRATWSMAGETAFQLRSQGITLPLSDLVVASLALENLCLLFHRDRHFDHIPQLRRFPEP